MDLFDRGVALGLEGYAKSYEQLWKDIRSCVDRCHKDGVIKLAVAEGILLSVYVHLYVSVCLCSHSSHVSYAPLVS